MLNDSLPTRDEMKAAALALAEKGWRLLPLHSVQARPSDDGRLACTCGDDECKSPGKHSSLRKRLENATNDTGTVSRWWSDEKKPVQNIGILTGRDALRPADDGPSPGGVLVLDIGAGGRASLARLEARYGELPPTLESATGAEGRHLWFLAPETGNFPTVSGRIGERIDCIGEQGFVVAPPSIHPTGDRYRWVNDLPMAPLPQWVVELWAPTPTTAAPTLTDEEIYTLDADDGRDPYAVCRGRVSGDEVRTSLGSLVRHLIRNQVEPDSALGFATSVNMRTCAPPLPVREVGRIVRVAEAEEKDRKRTLEEAKSAIFKARRDRLAGGAKPTLVEDLEYEARLRSIERAISPANPAKAALRAWLRAHLWPMDFDRTRNEIRFHCYVSGEVVTVPVAVPPAAVNQRLIGHIGDIEKFAHRAGAGATGKLLVQVINELVDEVPKRQRDDDESLSVQLVEALLSAKVWMPAREAADGEEARSPVATASGYLVPIRQYGRFKHEDGIGIIQHEGRELLVVRLSKYMTVDARNNVLKGDLRFRNLQLPELANLLRAAPGFLPKLVRPWGGEHGNKSRLRCMAVDVVAFEAAVERNSEPAEEIEDDRTERPERPKQAHFTEVAP